MWWHRSVTCLLCVTERECACVCLVVASAGAKGAIKILEKRHIRARRGHTGKDHVMQEVVCMAATWRPSPLVRSKHTLPHSVLTVCS